jgi:ferredoxin
MPLLRRLCCVVGSVLFRESKWKQPSATLKSRDFLVNCCNSREFRSFYKRDRANSRGEACRSIFFRRSLSSKKEPPFLDPNVEQYLSSLNVLDAVENSSDMSVLSKLKVFSRIVENLEAVYGKGKVTVELLQSFGMVGLVALAKAICREDPSLLNESAGGSKMEKSTYITVRFKVPHHQTEFDLPWHYASGSGQQQSSLLDLSKDSSIGAELLSEYMEASCGGNGSCSTCHVYIDTTNNDSTKESVVLSDATESELDMICLAYQPTKKSRLACQVRLLKVPPSMENTKQPALQVIIPPGVNNFWN